MDVLTSPPPPPPERLDLIPDRHCMSLHRVPFPSPSLRFLGWTKHIVLTHHCLITLEFIGTLEPSSTGLPQGFCLTPHCYCTGNKGHPTNTFDSAKSSTFCCTLATNCSLVAKPLQSFLRAMCHCHPFIHLKTCSSVCGVHAFVLEKCVLTDGFVVALKPV